MKHLKIFLFLFLLVDLNVSAQIKPLAVGDTIPDIAFEKMLNHVSVSGKLSDFKGKALILDFWFRECGSCVELMPELNRVQNEYKNDLKVLLVTWQSKQKIEAFWRDHKEAGKLVFTQAVEDSIARQYFPAAAFPHQVWIDKHGIVRSINDGQQLSSDNLNNLIKGAPLKVKTKQDEMDPLIHNAVAPMAGIRYEENKSKIIQYSYLSKARPEFAGMTSMVRDSNGTVRVKFMNTSYIQLYHEAYAGIFGRPLDSKNRVLHHDHNSLIHAYDFKTGQNIYCYDLIYQDTTTANFGTRMIRDLDRFLGFKSREITKKILSYVIEPDGKGSKYLEPLEADKPAYMTNHHLEKGMDIGINKIWAMSVAGRYIDSSDIPVIFNWPLDRRRVSFKVVWDPTHLDLMNEQLKKFNLKISLKKWETRVIELTDLK